MITFQGMWGIHKGIIVVLAILCLWLPSVSEEPTSMQRPSVNPYVHYGNRASNENHDKTKTAFRATGVIAMVGGGFAAYLFHEKSDREFDKYRVSAFTENTDKYREAVEGYDRAARIALGVAGAGAVAFMIPFTF